MPRISRQPRFSSAFIRDSEEVSDRDRQLAFSKRQQQDLKRLHELSSSVPRQKSEYQNANHQQAKSSYTTPRTSSLTKKEKEEWRDSEGDRLNDFGVDEDAEYCDDDDDVDDEIPLAELLRRRSIKQPAADRENSMS